MVIGQSDTHQIIAVGRQRRLTEISEREAAVDAFGARLGKPKAVTAVSHSLLVIIYHMLRDQQSYRDLGADFFEARSAAWRV